MKLLPIEELLDRANAEFVDFCGELVQKSPAQIMEGAYEKACRLR